MYSTWLKEGLWKYADGLPQALPGFLKTILISFIVSGCATLSPPDAEREFARDYPPVLATAEKHEYKNINDTSLNLWVYPVSNQSFASPRPAILFFFGGGWSQGSPSQFARQAKALNEVGLVTILVDYRVKQRHGTAISHAVEDARSALDWVHAHNQRLNIDTSRIAASGGSAGGHLAASLATLSNKAIHSHTPAALVLFNPALVLAKVENLYEPSPRFLSVVGSSPYEVSPYHHLRKGHPPTLIVHGSSDVVVPIRTVNAYCTRVRELGDACELKTFANAEHGFFNQEPHFGVTLGQTVDFLTQLGWIAAD